jgi:predicted  nucleic acid-binding Zn-ribbon protein
MPTLALYFDRGIITSLFREEGAFYWVMAGTNGLRDALERIHLIQTRLGDLNGRLRRGPLLLKTQEENIQKFTGKLEQLQTAHRSLVAEAKKKELDVTSHEQALAKRRLQLQEAKTNKEYQALQIQIQADEATRSGLDDEALEAIEKAEEFAKNFLPAQADVKKAQELYETTKQKFLSDKPHIESEIVEYNKQLQSVESELPQEFREVYIRLVRSVGGSNALAVVEKQKYCGGCNHQIPVNSLAQILAKKPITCSSCARLLYVPADFQFDKG